MSDGLLALLAAAVALGAWGWSKRGPTWDRYAAQLAPLAQFIGIMLGVVCLAALLTAETRADYRYAKLTGGAAGILLAAGWVMKRPRA